jgi:NADPH:quinone reductase-like Zn-dependent oxidoreductase
MAMKRELFPVTQRTAFLNNAAESPLSTPFHEKLAAYLAAGVLHTPVHKVFPLDQALEAIAEAAREKRSGKVLLRMF